MAKAQLTVHTENILPIIKKWLYSEKDIFLRELVSNACDALGKCKVLRDAGELTCLDEDLKVEIRIDKENKQLYFSDTGIGMTAGEVEKYIAQVAFSGAEEFISKYETGNEKDQIIGHFGLGFYSAYMVSKSVSIQTKSYKEDSSPVFWTCDGSTEYEIDQGSRNTRGTDIILDIEEGSEEFLDESKVKALLQQYCSFLPYPIYLNEERINPKEPLWMKPASSCTKEEYLEFYHLLHPMEEDPVFWIHLNVDYPFTLRGILYFPKIHRKFDWSENRVKLFCNRVFVSDNCKDLIPDYLGALQGVLDSPDIPLNVSRSYLQMDKTVRQLSVHIAKKVADKLSTTYASEKEHFLTIWPDIELIIKLGMMQDEKFQEKALDFLVWKTLQGSWTTIDEYLERNQDKHKDKVFYAVEADSPFLSLYKEKNIEVLLTTSAVDTTLMTHLERKKKGVRFQRIDGDVDASILDPSKDCTLLDTEGKTRAVRLSELISEKLGKDTAQVEAKSLASDSLPGFIVIDEDMRRMKEYFALSQQQAPGALFGGKKTFVVNTNSKLISSLPSLNEKDPELARELVVQLYELSLLSQKELEASQLSTFVERSSRVLEKLLEKKTS
ncbi:MAG: molecular chaperone HtpG [Chlamydiae bacterium]|nr:molecular chaperone HtpG [Chlamydiota bacterium]